MGQGEGAEGQMEGEDQKSKMELRGMGEGLQGRCGLGEEALGLMLEGKDQNSKMEVRGQWGGKSRRKYRCNSKRVCMDQKCLPSLP